MNNFQTFKKVVLHADIALLIFYLIFRKQVLDFSLSIFDKVTGGTWHQYRFLAWSLVLFTACAVCSFLRKKTFDFDRRMKTGTLVFEILVLSALVLIVSKALTQAETIDPYWIVSIGWGSYLFEVVTTAGAGYVLADFFIRIRDFLKSK